MIDTKWTPGPWEVIGDRLAVRMSAATPNSYGAVPYAAIGGLNLDAGGYAELEANAALIAAAPDLYKALEQVTSFMAWKYGDDDPYVLTNRKAMAKARGES